MTHTITVPIELSDELLESILVTAFDSHHGGSWYWAEPRRPKHENEPLAFRIENDNFIHVTIIEREASSGTRRKWCVIDYPRLAKGIEKLFTPGCLPKRGDIRDAILQNDGGQIDIIGADIIVQLAMFGELVYG